MNCRFSFFIKGPNGSVKFNFSHKIAKIVGCEIISIENYDEFITLDLPKIVGCEGIYGKLFQSWRNEIFKLWWVNNTLDLPILLKICMYFQFLYLHIMIIFSSCTKDAIDWGFPLLMDMHMSINNDLNFRCKFLL